MIVGCSLLILMSTFRWDLFYLFCFIRSVTCYIFSNIRQVAKNKQHKQHKQPVNPDSSIDQILSLCFFLLFLYTCTHTHMLTHIYLKPLSDQFEGKLEYATILPPSSGV